MEFILNIISVVKDIFGFVLGKAYDLCSFLGYWTMDLLTKLDPGCVDEFNRIFDTTHGTVSIILGMLEMTLLLSVLKYIITGMREISAGNEYGAGTYPGCGYGGMTDASEWEEALSGIPQHLTEANDLNNQLFHQQMMDEAGREAMRISMDEAMKAVTPADEGGYVQGPYLNPSDTFAYEDQQSMFDDSFGGFDSTSSLGDFGFDDSFGSFGDFGCDSGFDSFNDFGCHNSFSSFNDFGTGF